MNDRNDIDEFLRQKANYGLVINCDLQQIESIKRFLLEADIKVIYQKVSLHKLLIHEEA